MKQDFTIQGKMSFQVYLAVHKELAKWRRIYIRIILFISAAAVLFGVYYVENKNLYSDLFMIIVGCGCGLLLYAIFLSPIQFRLRAKRNWNHYPSAHKPLYINLSSQGIEGRDDLGNPVLTKWKNVVYMKENRHAFMFYLSPLLPICVPKPLMEEHEVSEFRAFIKSVCHMR